MNNDKLINEVNKISGITEQLEHIATNEWCKGGFWNVCHKGGVACCSPQNSIEGIEKANEFGYKAIEVDVGLTLDKKWICFHDETLDFLTNGTGKYNEKTYDELKLLTYDSTTGGNTTFLQTFYFPVRIPLLEDFIAKAKAFNMCIALDVRGFQVYSEVEFKSLVDLIKKYDMEKQTVMWGVNRDIIRKYSYHIALTASVGSKISADETYAIMKPYMPNVIDNRIDTNYDKDIINGLHNYGIKCMSGFPLNGDIDNKINIDKWVQEYGLDYAVCDNYLYGGEF